MAYASLSGRARTSSTSPQAHAICDRCGFRYNRANLNWQYEWRGNALLNTQILVCRPCLDVPAEQLRAIIIPADPVPIYQPRPQDYVAASADNFVLTEPTVYDPVTGIPIPGTTILTTEAGTNITPQEIGRPVGLAQNAIMPLKGTVHYGVVLPVLSVSVGSSFPTIVTVTCSAVHNLSTGDQISVEGLINNAGDGFYSVIVTTATAFTYEVSTPIVAGSLMTGGTRIVTAIVGLPYDETVIPKTGGK